MSERKYRMQQLGLTEKEYDIYKSLYNNVSITEKDRSINTGEQMYVKFAKFLAEQEKPSIWKDPKIELPEELSRIIVKYEEKGLEFINSCVQYSFNNLANRQEFVDLYTNTCLNITGKVFKWCYEKDLIKQAKGE